MVQIGFGCKMSEWAMFEVSIPWWYKLDPVAASMLGKLRYVSIPWWYKLDGVCCLYNIVQMMFQFLDGTNWISLGKSIRCSTFHVSIPWWYKLDFPLQLNAVCVVEFQFLDGTNWIASGYFYPLIDYGFQFLDGTNWIEAPTAVELLKVSFNSLMVQIG